MSQPSSRLRRIALDAAGRRHDIAVPKGEALAGALAAVGIHLGAGDRVFGPDGAAVDAATPASELREGGLYAVAGPAVSERRTGARGTGARGTGAADSPVSPLPWAIAGFGAVAVTLAAGFGWMPRGIGPTEAVAIAAVAVAVLAAIRMVAAASPRSRAAATPVVVIAALFALLAMVSPRLGWSAPQLLMVTAAAAVVGIRAAPSLLVGVDPGYHLDYGRFMVLRWTVRGRVPEFIERVDEDRVREIVSVAEARLEASVRLLSLIAAAGIPAAVVAVTGEDPVARIGGWAFAAFAVAGLLLTSRRMAASSLRVPPRAAVLVGLVGFAILLAPRLPGAAMTAAAVALLFAGVVAAVMVPPLARGERSLGWSRTGDIVDAIAVAFAVPSGLLAAGTMNLLQGVLAG